jgi:hypothetical protein
VLSDLEADVPKSRLECLLRVDLGHSPIKRDFP